MSTQRKHVPTRTCVICREQYPKRQLRRFVSMPEGVYHDPSGKAAGRGAYICSSTTCRERAATTPLLSKALRTSFSEEDRQRIREVGS